jgi:anti-sigma B factor antagonist
VASPGTIVSTPAGDGQWLVELAGEHDLSTAPRLREELDHAVAEGGSVVVDLAEVTFVDSSVIGVLVNAHLGAGNDDGRRVVVVVPAHATARRVLDLVGAGEVLRVVESREEALVPGRPI